VGERHGQRKNSNIVEVIADFADNLAGPHEAIVAIPAQQFEEFAHQPARLRGGWGAREEVLYLISLRVSKIGLRLNSSPLHQKISNF
jgi:hypothetical protein